MQRMFNVDRWLVIEPGQVLEYPSPRPRLVRIEVNSPDVANLYLLNADQEAFHLARICGRDTVEFVSPGAFSLTAADGALSVYTVDGTSVAHTVDAPQSFTKIVERRKRSPELELIARMMNSNMERRLAQQAEELSAQYERRERERETRRDYEREQRETLDAANRAAVLEAARLSGNAGAEPPPAVHVEDGARPGPAPGGGKGKARGDAPSS